MPRAFILSGVLGNTTRAIVNSEGASHTFRHATFYVRELVIVIDGDALPIFDDGKAYAKLKSTNGIVDVAVIADLSNKCGLQSRYAKPACTGYFKPSLCSAYLFNVVGGSIKASCIDAEAEPQILSSGEVVANLS
ncbi:hypothetical protein PsWM33_04332 [Pseudovibrio sp. WM33]|nr:hypothetical protein PsWM33_04332 [Pseudovibrio sp. WM33]